MKCIFFHFSTKETKSSGISNRKFSPFLTQPKLPHLPAATDKPEKERAPWLVETLPNNNVNLLLLNRFHSQELLSSANWNAGSLLLYVYSVNLPWNTNIRDSNIGCYPPAWACC